MHMGKKTLPWWSSDSGVSHVENSSKSCDRSQSDYLCGNRDVAHKNLPRSTWPFLPHVWKQSALGLHGWVWLAFMSSFNSIFKPINLLLCLIDLVRLFVYVWECLLKSFSVPMNTMTGFINPFHSRVELRKVTGTHSRDSGRLTASRASTAGQGQGSFKFLIVLVSFPGCFHT